MRIAFIGQKGIPAVSGGVEKHIEELATRLSSRGHEVLVYTRPSYTDRSLTSYKGVRLVSLPSIATKHLDAITHTFLACLDVIFRRQIDVIHFHSIGPSSLIWLVRIFKPRTPVVATFHTQCYMHSKWGVFARLYLKLGEIACCKFSTQCITVSRNLKLYVEKQYRRKAVYIPNGVEPVSYAAPKNIRQWGLEKGNYIVAISRLVRHKGLHHLIKAYNQLRTDKKLVIVGGSAYTDHYVNELKSLAKDNVNIIFTGQQSGETLAELFSNAYLFVQPSESEGLSIALLEAMAYGTPVLVSDILENREAVGDAGFLFENANVEDLEDKLQEMIEKPEALESKRQAALKRAQTQYDWRTITDQVINIYETELAKFAKKAELKSE